MKTRNAIFILWLGVIALLTASLLVPQTARAQSCDPATGGCPPPSGGGGGKKRPTAIPPTTTATPTATHPFLPLMPLSGGGGGGSGGIMASTPTSTPCVINGIANPLYCPTPTDTLDPYFATLDACVEAGLAEGTPWAYLQVVCPPSFTPTATRAVFLPPVAGPVLLRPGVISMIIGGLVVVLAGARILVFRNR